MLISCFVNTSLVKDQPAYKNCFWRPQDSLCGGGSILLISFYNLISCIPPHPQVTREVYTSGQRSTQTSGDWLLRMTSSLLVYCALSIRCKEFGKPGNITFFWLIEAQRPRVLTGLIISSCCQGRGNLEKRLRQRPVLGSRIEPMGPDSLGGRLSWKPWTLRQKIWTTFLKWRGGPPVILSSRDLQCYIFWLPTSTQMEWDKKEKGHPYQLQKHHLDVIWTCCHLSPWPPGGGGQHAQSRILGEALDLRQPPLSCFPLNIPLISPIWLSTPEFGCLNLKKHVSFFFSS